MLHGRPQRKRKPTVAIQNTRIETNASAITFRENLFMISSHLVHDANAVIRGFSKSRKKYVKNHPMKTDSENSRPRMKARMTLRTVIAFPSRQRPEEDRTPEDELGPEHEDDGGPNEGHHGAARIAVVIGTHQRIHPANACTSRRRPGDEHRPEREADGVQDQDAGHDGDGVWIGIVVHQRISARVG
jgi:hypothetical protein